MNHIFKICKHVCLLKPIRPSIRQFVMSHSLLKYVDEPDYIKYTKPQVPVYDLLNIQIKGYDFTVLEHYAKYVHRIALHLDFNVTDAWATPHQAWKVTNTEPGSSKIVHDFLLNTYERNIQIDELPCYCAPLFFEVIQRALPAGISVSIHPHEPQHSEIRYIPDFELLALKEQLTESNTDLNKK
ncbi:large ribosomal subunit protein mL48 [Parasteatoda tepidariorum]|uniref:large ribosomal subunit protein mL48 n=1 Tax=Parasteatoda tepidariorum TaxID=114398 RepID=UPI00077FE003|nr:39S ribosomal protein L48, mitochondrial [Parasteatoda tepidariorum]